MNENENTETTNPFDEVIDQGVNVSGADKMNLDEKVHGAAALTGFAISLGLTGEGTVEVAQVQDLILAMIDSLGEEVFNDERISEGVLILRQQRVFSALGLA